MQAKLGQLRHCDLNWFGVDQDVQLDGLAQEHDRLTQHQHTLGRSQHLLGAKRDDPSHCCTALSHTSGELARRHLQLVCLGLEHFSPLSTNHRELVKSLVSMGVNDGENFVHGGHETADGTWRVGTQLRDATADSVLGSGQFLLGRG